MFNPSLKTPIVAASVILLLSLDPFAVASAIGGDPQRGKDVYQRCLGCHSLKINRTGPRHCGLLGRKAGTQSGYNYSKAMTESGITWTAETLDDFLTAPLKALPGTSMGYAGVRSATDRADLIAYLSTAMDGTAQCK